MNYIRNNIIIPKVALKYKPSGKPGVDRERDGKLICEHGTGPRPTREVKKT